MNPVPAIIDPGYAWMGLFPAAAVVIALIINVSATHKRDMNRKAAVATNVLCVTLLIESAAWMVGIFGGGTESGFFWTVVICAALHIVAACIASMALREIRLHPKWAHGRQRAGLGFWLNILMLALLAAWLYLQADTQLRERIFS